MVLRMCVSAHHGSSYIATCCIASKKKQLEMLGTYNVGQSATDIRRKEMKNREQLLHIVYYNESRNLPPATGTCQDFGKEEMEGIERGTKGHIMRGREGDSGNMHIHTQGKPEYPARYHLEYLTLKMSP